MYLASYIHLRQYDVQGHLQPPSLFDKILVPCDGSQPSVNALNKAVELSRSNSSGKSEIILLYVISEIDLAPQYDQSGLALPESSESRQHLRGIYLYMEKQAFEMLDSLRKRLKNTLDDHCQLTIRVEVVHGSPPEKIIEFAEEEDVDLIVMGNIGLKGISKLKTIGSVSRKVSESAIQPVMIVPYKE
jgi:nucleotide-binding universal stress UspA family protein